MVEIESVICDDFDILDTIPSAISTGWSASDLTTWGSAGRRRRSCQGGEDREDSVTTFIPGLEFPAFSETHTIEGVKPVVKFC